MELLTATEGRRRASSADLDPTRRVELGQFFTPDSVAQFLASMFEPVDAPGQLLDPGAGVGSLTAAFVARWTANTTQPLQVAACEVDPTLHSALADTLDHCSDTPTVKSELIADDFIEWATTRLTLPPEEGFTHVIMNPPYRKIGTQSRERTLMRAIGVDSPNLYAAFLTLGIRLLRPGGQLVAITPRSFANGPYFRTFRADLLRTVALRRIHVYESREAVFADSDVLQENVVFLAARTNERQPVRITSSLSPSATEITSREVPFAELVHPDDSEQFIHLAPNLENATVASAVSRLPSRLQDLRLSVSTGRVVDFRSRDHLRSDPGPETAPLIYPTHIHNGGIVWPREGKKPNALLRADAAKLLLPAGTYVLVKRFSAKEERRRVVAALVSTDDLPGEWWAFENHLNVFHDGNAGIDPALARGLAVWLNSTPVDLAFRQFSGHTQVNATDLRNMRYPTAAELQGLGHAAGKSVLAQEKIDELVSAFVSGLER